jgi:hypothetical protein
MLPLPRESFPPKEGYERKPVPYWLEVSRRRRTGTRIFVPPPMREAGLGCTREAIWRSAEVLLVVFAQACSSEAPRTVETPDFVPVRTLASNVVVEGCSGSARGPVWVSAECVFGLFAQGCFFLGPTNGRDTDFLSEVPSRWVALVERQGGDGRNVD